MSPVSKVSKQNITDKIGKADPKALIDYTRKLIKERQREIYN